jgi:hypothetical protein
MAALLVDVFADEQSGGCTRWRVGMVGCLAVEGCGGRRAPCGGGCALARGGLVSAELLRNEELSTNLRLVVGNLG